MDCLLNFNTHTHRHASFLKSPSPLFQVSLRVNSDKKLTTPPPTLMYIALFTGIYIYLYVVWSSGKKNNDNFLSTHGQHDIIVIA